MAVSAFVLLKCPPLWRDYDGLIQITNHPNDMVVLQYPAAYPFFSRMHVYAAQTVQGWRTHHRTPIHILKAVVLNDAGVVALMISQQVALALALTALVKNAAKGLGARWCMALILVSNASLFIMANLISTEALSESLVIALVAVSLGILQAAELSALGAVAYGLCLYFSIMTRHANSIFAMLLPLALVLAIAVEAIRSRRLSAGPWKSLAIFVVVGLACIGAAKLTTRGLCRVFDVEYRSISARATSERLGFVDLMSPPEREAFLADLEKSSEDPVVKEAIPLLARPASWVQQRSEIEAILQRQSPGMDEKALKVKADYYLDVVASLYFQTHNHYLVQETLKSIWRCLSATTPAQVSAYYLETGIWSIDLYASTPDLSKKTHGLAVCSPEAQKRIIAFQTNPWLKLWRWAPHGAVLLGASILSLLFLLRGYGQPARPIFALATALTGLTATGLTFILVNYNPRFTTVADLFAFLALAVVAGHWFETRREGAAAGS